MPGRLIVVCLAVVGLPLTSFGAADARAGCQVVASMTGAVNSDFLGVDSGVKGTIHVDTVCSNPDAPAPTQGGGEGGETLCETRPFGDMAEVQAVWAAVNAAQAPNPSDPNYTEDVLNPGAPAGEVVVDRSWFRIRGSNIQVKYMVRCPGTQWEERWVNVVPDSGGNLVPQVRAVDLLSALHAEVVRRLPTPVPRIGPADENPNGWSFVQHRTFFWIDQAAGQWDVVSGSTSAGGISVTVQAVPERLVVNPGDGSEVIVCHGPQPAVTRETYRPDIEGCAHRYTNSSAMAPNGETYPVVVTIVWHASWSASTGEGGDLGYISTTSPVRELAVAEVQSVIVNQEP